MFNAKSDQVRLSAAIAILDRGFGKPKESLEFTGKDGGAVQTKSVVQFYLPNNGRNTPLD